MLSLASAILTALVILTPLIDVHAAVIPDYMKICSRNDPNVSECVRESVHNLRPYLKEGIKELNVPSLEPLYIGDMNILDGATSGVNVKAKKLLIHGASNFEIKKLKISDNLRRFDFDLELPHLYGEGAYIMDGRLLALPLRGNGSFTGNFKNFRAHVTVKMDIKAKNDIEYVTIKDLIVKIRTGTGNLRLENLFNGDRQLGDVINNTINDNFEAFANELTAPIARVLEKKFSAITSKIMDNFTYDDLFPV